MSDESEDHETTESSEEEDENAKEWTDEVEKTFLKTLCSLKSKDPKIYDEKVQFFKNELISSRQPPKSVETVKEQPLYLKDYERKIILEKNGVLTDEESDEEKVAKLEDERARSPTYVEEQRMLKDNFKKFLEDNSDDDENDTTNFLKIKVKSDKEKAKEEEDYIEWLKGQREEINDKDFAGDIKYLRDYWTDPNLNEGEKFLRDYVLNKRYLEPDQDTKSESEISFSEEEKILEECDEYEQKYNFRFEEPDKNFIKTYPRVIENSLRRKDEKRKQKRETLKKRKEEKLEVKRLEVKRLKKEKKRELLERIKNLKQITGNEQLGFDDKELQKDFNPDEYDKKMSELFNEEFYELGEDDDEKPQFSDLESEEDVDDYEDESESLPIENCPTDEFVENDVVTAEDPNFIMDCDYDPNAVEESKLKRKTRSAMKRGHKREKLKEEKKKKPPIFDPAEKTIQEYVDEYYGLDFEDMIGDLPCRFKYREVMPNDFGLTVEEILAADDKELNKWASLNKISTIRPENAEKFDKKIYARRAVDMNLKKKLLPSLFVDEPLENHEATVSEDQSMKKKKKKKRRHKKSVNSEDVKTSIETKNDVILKDKGDKKAKIKTQNEKNHNKSAKKRKAPTENTEVSAAKKANKGFNNSMQTNGKNKFHNKNTFNKKNDTVCEVADERLKAYGINPKKFKNKLKYGPKS